MRPYSTAVAPRSLMRAWNFAMYLVMLVSPFETNGLCEAGASAVKGCQGTGVRQIHRPATVQWDLRFSVVTQTADAYGRDYTDKRTCPRMW